MTCRNCKRVPFKYTDFANVYENVLSCFVVPVASVARENCQPRDAVREGVRASSIRAETADEMPPASFEEEEDGSRANPVADVWVFEEFVGAVEDEENYLVGGWGCYSIVFDVGARRDLLVET